MAENNCENCPARAKFDKNPRSIGGRIWRWHTNWCPGWKAYMKSLPDDQRNAIAKKYKMEKFMIISITN